MTQPLAVIVLAAGLGKRTGVGLPKVLLPLCGRTLLHTVLATVAELGPQRLLVVVHHGQEQVEKSLAKVEGLGVGIEIVPQGEARGTGHAVQVAIAALRGFAGDVLVVYGDVPLIGADTLLALREHRQDAAVSLLTVVGPSPAGMGRVLRDARGALIGIREDRDCSAEELEIEEFNAGFYCFDGARLPDALAGLSPDNAQGELYLTDTIAWFLAAGEPVQSVTLQSEGGEDGAVDEEVTGVNTLADLAFVRSVKQERILLEHMAAGVIIEDPATTYIDQDVEIGPGTVILPCTVIRAGVRIGAGCEVGPFAHLRVGTRLEAGAAVGNFVETKKTLLGRDSKAKHLTYLGDATIGAGVNIGAGTITANYDGVGKHETHIGDRSFVGSGTVLVAPSRMGQGAMTGAGAVVTKNTAIPDGEVWVGVPARPIGTPARAVRDRSERDRSERESRR